MQCLNVLYRFSSTNVRTTRQKTKLADEIQTFRRKIDFVGRKITKKKSRKIQCKPSPIPNRKSTANQKKKKRSYIEISYLDRTSDEKLYFDQFV